MAGGSDESADTLAGVWNLTEIHEATIPEGTAPTLDFRGDLLVGQSTCNVFKAQVLQSGDNLSFGPMEPLNKVCGKAEMEAEIRLFRALQRVTRFEIDGKGDLLLYGFDVLQARAAR